MEYLLQNTQCDVNAMTKSKCTPLHEAVYRRHLEIVKTLIKKKANVNAGALGEQTPLHTAAKNGNIFLQKFRENTCCKQISIQFFYYYSSKNS